MPLRKSDYYTPPARSTRSASESTEALPAVPNANERVTARHLTADQRAAYNTDFAEFKFLHEIYEKEHTKVTSLRAWMRATVSSEYAVNALDPADDVRTAYLNLKAQAGTAALGHMRRRLNDEYQQTVKPWNRAPKIMEKWILAWETVMQKGERYDMPYVKMSNIWAYDFLKAVRPVFSQWVTSYTTSNRTMMDTGDLEFRSLSGEFRRVIQEAQESGSLSRIGKGSFLTLGNEKSPHQPSDRMDASSDRSGDDDFRKHQGASRKRKGREAGCVGEENTPKCRACGGRHDLRQCFYLFSRKAFKGWKERSNVRKRVDKNIREDSVLAEEVNRLKKGKDKGDRDTSGNSE